jgi:large subunit ribosomal protein L30e
MKTLEKVIKEAIASDKYKRGVKEVLQSVKGSKLIILSRTVPTNERSKIEEQAKSASVTLYEYPGTSVQLGKMFNKPFRMNAVALKTGSAEEISSILSEAKTAKK